MELIDADTQKLWLILKRRWLPAVGVFSCTVGLSVVAVLMQKPVYEAEGKLLLKKINDTSAATGLSSRIGELDTLAQQTNPLKTEAAVLSSIPLAQQTITTLNLKDEEGDPLLPEGFLKKQKVKQLVATDILQVSYKSTDSKEAAAVVNKLMSLYTGNNLLSNRSTVFLASEFITNKLPKTEARVRQAEANLRKFKEQNQIVSLDDEAKSAVGITKELESQINETQAALANANARFASLQQQVGMSSQQAVAMNSLNQSPGIQNVLTEFQQTEDRLAIERTRLQDNHPTIVNLKLRQAALQALLQKRVDTTGFPLQVQGANLQIGASKQKLNEELVKLEQERLGLVNQLASLTNTQKTYKQKANVFPKLEQTQRELERQLGASQSTYQILLQKLQELKVAENQNTGNASIIEPALVPIKASIKQPALIVALGMVLGVLLFGATIVVLEVKDTLVKTLKEAQELFGYTCLGIIPLLGKKSTSRNKDLESTVPELPVRDTPRSPLSEAYRMLQANLKFLSSDKPLQVIVVTSSVPKEGKSTVSANLAIAMAQIGHRVLLIDGDMRRPTQHHIWKLNNITGLSDAIVGQAEFKVSVKTVMKNLDLLTAGVTPPNPIALLNSQRMAALIEDFSATYDFVIIDAPPLLVAADALTLGKMTDGVLLVTRPGVVDSNAANAAKDALEHSNQNVLGLVVNGVIVENESDSYFYFAKEYYTDIDDTALKVSTKEHKAV